MTWKGECTFPATTKGFTEAFIEASQELVAQYQDRFIIQMTITESILMVGLLQLALRHPDLSSSMVVAGKSMVETMIASLGCDYPIIAAGLSKGFDPSQDIEELST